MLNDVASCFSLENAMIDTFRISIVTEYYITLKRQHN